MKKIIFIVAMCLTILGLNACSITPASDDMINPDADYVYFFGKTCPHCQDLNEWMAADGTHSKHDIEKREVYFNAENGAAFQAVTNALGIEEGSAGVPFMIRKSDNEYRIGVEPIKKLLWESELEDMTSDEKAIYDNELVEDTVEPLEETTQEVTQ